MKVVAAACKRVSTGGTYFTPAMMTWQVSSDDVAVEQLASRLSAALRQFVCSSTEAFPLYADVLSPMCGAATHLAGDLDHVVGYLKTREKHARHVAVTLHLGEFPSSVVDIR